MVLKSWDVLVVAVTDETLQRRGVYGVLIPCDGVLEVHGQTLKRFRHPHPSEVGILSGCQVPPVLERGSLRLWLAGLGQMASPLHSVWVGAQLRHHLEVLFGAVDRCNPDQILVNFISDFVDYSKHVLSRHVPTMLSATSAAAPLDVTMEYGEACSHQTPATEFPPATLPSDPRGSVVSESRLDDAVMDLPGVTTTDALPDATGGFAVNVAVDLSNLDGEPPVPVPTVPVVFEQGESVDDTPFPATVDPVFSHVGDDLSFTLVHPDGSCMAIALKSTHATASDLIRAETSFSHQDARLQLWNVLTQRLLADEDLLVGQVIQFHFVGPLATICDDDEDDEPILDIPATAPFQVDVPVCSEPLASLGSAQLLDMSPPVVSSCNHLFTLIRQPMDKSVRSQILANQGLLMADDELRFHIYQLLGFPQCANWAVLDPVMACQLMNGVDPWMISHWLSSLPFRPDGVVTVVRVFTHWIPVVWRWNATQLDVATWRTVREPGSLLHSLNQSVCAALHLESVSISGMCAPCSELDMCGLSALLFLRRELLFEGLPATRHELLCAHAVFRRTFQDSLPLVGTFRPWIWGSGLDAQSQTRLAGILEQHGVPTSQVSNRITSAVQALGLLAVQRAILSAQPWRNLKSLANQHRPVFQWVLPDELASAVEAKGQTTKRSKAAKAKPQPKSAPAKPIQPASLDPTKLAVPDGIFVDSHGRPVLQIQPHQLGPLSTGVALASSSLVDQFLRAPGPIAESALGILLLDVNEPPFEVKLQWNQVRLAVRCVANGEPVLISGALIQLGKDLVSKAQQKVIDQPPCADVASTKFAVYKDSVTCAWSDLIKSPVSYIFDHLSCLQVCNEDACTCDKWHATDGLLTSPILDVWRKQWVSMGFHPAKPLDAEVYLVNVRHVASCTSRILSLSGQNGIFADPRTLDAKMPSQHFQIIWLPKRTFSEVCHIAQVNADVLGPARMGSRFGVRVEAHLAAGVSARIRPDNVVLAQGVRMEFEMGPLSFGLDRNGVAALCKGIGWVAKAINPIRTVTGDLGVIWLLHAVTEPSNNVLMTKNGEVVISKVLQKPAAGSTGASVVVSSATASLCAAQDAHDPWLVNDPWKSGVAKVPASRPVVNDAMMQLKDVESRLEQSILAKIQPSTGSSMETDEMDRKLEQVHNAADSRLTALESRMQHLATRQGSLEQTVHDNAQATKAQFSQFQFQVSAQLDSQSTQISDMFAKQMREFERLLEKRQRTEWRWGRTTIPGDGGGGHLVCSTLGLVASCLLLAVFGLCSEPLVIGLVLILGLPLALFGFGVCRHFDTRSCLVPLGLPGFSLCSCFGSEGVARLDAVSTCSFLLGFWPWLFKGRLTWLVVIWTLLSRVGEAHVPGPSDMEWSLGIFNSAGLPGKAHLVPSSADVWAVSETHLTKKGATRFCAALKKADSPYRLLTGNPVPPRHEGSDLGTYSGVGFLSKHPIRRVPHAWLEVVYDSSRLEIATFPIRDFWVTGLVLYGAPTGPTHPRAREVTNDLVNHICDRLQCCRGPVFVGGDVNQDLQYVPAVSRLVAMGFVEVQDLWYRQTGQLPRPTCKHKTQRDFLWLSPQLVSMFTRCEVDHDIWIDHATVRAVFKGSACDMQTWCWPQPAPLDWSQASPCRPVSFVDFSSLDPTVQYRKVWEAVEQHVPSAYPQSTLVPGRAQCFQPIQVQLPAPHLKPSRGLDRPAPVVPQRWLHFHRFRQCRRLQSYVRLVTTPVMSSSHVEHRSALWRSILASPGYRPGFLEWWAVEVDNLGIPPLSVVPPGLDVASLVHQVVCDDCVKVEASLHKHEAYVAKLKRKHDPNHVFRSVRRDPPQQVDVLLESTQTTVQSVNTDTGDGEVVTEPSVEWGESVPVFVAGAPVEVLAHCDDSFWISDPAAASVGDTLICRKHLGTIPEIFQAFEHFWKAKWAKHAHTSVSQWQTILSFAERFLPSVHAPPFVPSIDGFRAAVSKKKRQAATGPDGVRREDVLSLADDEIRSILSLYGRAMESGEWPEQMLEGVIRSLAKTQSPSGVSDYRPVVIYSFLYRVWSSMAARHWLGHLDSIFSPHVFGSRAGKRAGHMWRKVLDELESAQQTDVPVGGVVFDLHAAFNLVPRLPTLGFAKLAGVDSPTLTAWTSFLASNRRRFHVRGCISGPILSTCGMPEGCALSCLGMALLDEVYLLWLRHLAPQAVGYTCVDDWEVVATTESCVQRAIEATTSFALAMDLVVDSKKSYCWGSHRPLRRALGPLGFPVLLDSRSLGAHVVYCRQVRNATIQRQLVELDSFWPKLASAYGSHHQKCMAVRISAWPRVLHSVSASILGLKHFVALRSQALQALSFQKPGANPMLHMLLDPGHLDPHLFAIVVTLRDHRSMGATAAQLESLSLAACDSLGSLNTVSQILVQRVHQLGWAISTDGVVTDRFGSFSLSEVSWQELDLRLRWAWHSVVSVSVAHRRDFARFHLVDVDATRLCLQDMSPSDQGVYRRLLNDSMFTNRDAWRWSVDGSDRCCYCGELDSVPHRLWHCSHTSDLRLGLSPALLDLVPSLPSVSVEHGWFLRPPSKDVWIRALLSLTPVVRPLIDIPNDPFVTLDFFTDGSCLWPDRPSIRLASWSVILAGPLCLNPSALSARLVAADVLPGLLQSPYRAELFAVAATLAIAVDLHLSGHLRIWSDCLSVVTKCRLLLEGGWTPTASQPHADLWRWIHDSVQMLGCDRIQVLKVAAHEAFQRNDNDLQYWKSLHNFCADEAAKVANACRPTWFWNVWQMYADEVCTYAELGRQLATHQVGCMQRWFQERPEVVAPTVQQTKQRREFPQKWTVPDLSQPVPKFRKLFGAALTERFSNWWQTVFRSDDSPLIWISFGQLFLHWIIHEKHPGVVKIGKLWMDAGDQISHSARNYNFRTRSKWFRLMFQEFVRSLGMLVGVATLQPKSDHLSCHIGCVSAPVHQTAWEAVESFLRCRVHHPIRLPKQLDSLTLEMW